MNYIDDLPDKKIDDLPAIDIWPLIFRNLSINDLFNCRLVNKKFKYFSTNGVYRLIIFETKHYKYDYNYYWRYNKETIDNKYQISFEIYLKWKSLNLFNLNENLKYLIISQINNTNLKELSYLTNLEYLQIEFNLFREDQFINLDHLKFLILTKDCCLLEFKLNLNTPKLIKLEVNNMKNIYFDSDPKSIKYLKINFNDVSISKIFNNLEIIELKSSQNINQLIVFHKLRKIKFLHSSAIDVIRNIFNKKYDLRKDIDIYFKDVKIENIDKLNEYKRCPIDLKYQIKNYNQLDLNLSTIINQLDYNELESWLYNVRFNLTSSFFNKFSHLIKIVAYQNVNNAHDLIWFLRNLKNLRELDLRDKSLDQNFYDNLPNSIRKLHIVSNTTINYDFILKFSELNEFKIYGNIDLSDLALLSFENLKYLKKFQFEYNKEIEITKSRDRFLLFVSLANYISPINCYNQLVNLLSKIRLKIGI